MGVDSKLIVSQVTYGCQECHKALQSLEKLLQYYRGNPRAPRLSELLQAVLAFGTTEQGFPPGLENDTLSYLRCLDHGWQIGKLTCFLTHIFQSELAVMCRFQEISPNSI